VKQEAYKSGYSISQIFISWWYLQKGNLVVDRVGLVTKEGGTCTKSFCQASPLHSHYPAIVG